MIGGIALPADPPTAAAQHVLNVSSDDGIEVVGVGAS